jgi:hypothetical protein
MYLLIGNHYHRKLQPLTRALDTLYTTLCSPPCLSSTCPNPARQTVVQRDELCTEAHYAVTAGKPPVRARVVPAQRHSRGRRFSHATRHAARNGWKGGGWRCAGARQRMGGVRVDARGATGASVPPGGGPHAGRAAGHSGGGPSLHTGRTHETDACMYSIPRAREG